ncbi:MAG: hypothetical protein QM680_01600 [Luteolibacter sp.]
MGIVLDACRKIAQSPLWMRKWCVLVFFPIFAAQAADDPRRDYAFGVWERLNGNGPRAAEYFEKARLADPTAWTLAQLGVEQRMAAKDVPGALKLYRELAEKRRGELAVQLAFSDFLQNLGPSFQAERAKFLETALKRWPGEPQLVQRSFSTLVDQGGMEKARRLLETMAKTPAAAPMYAALTQTAYPSEDEAAANRVAARYEAAVTAEPKQTALARAASDYFRNRGDSSRAIRMLELHAAALPSSLDLRTRLGILYFAARENAKGEAALQAVLKIDPGHAQAHQALTKFYRQTNRPALARTHAAEVLKRRGGSVGDFLKLSEEFLAANEPRQARLLLEKAVFDVPGNFDLLSQLAIATRRDSTARDLAPRAFQDAEEALPDGRKFTPDFLVESAEVFLTEGKSGVAETRLRDAIRAYPADAKKPTAAALRRLAGIWETGNRNLEAARSLRQRADLLDPPP